MLLRRCWLALVQWQRLTAASGRHQTAHEEQGKWKPNLGREGQGQAAGVDRAAAAAAAVPREGLTARNQRRSFPGIYGDNTTRFRALEPTCEGG